MAEKKNIVKFRNRREINIGLVIAVGLLILVLVNLYRYATTPHLSLYEVQEGSKDSTFHTLAMVLREEKVYRTDKAGYLNFYFREGARVSKGAKVYSLNDSTDFQDLLQTNEDNPALKENDLLRLKENIRDFYAAYSGDSFGKYYDLKEDFLSDYLRYRDVSMLDALSQNQNHDQASVAFSNVYSELSGTISYYSDAYDGYTVEQLNGSEFTDKNRTVPERNKPYGLSAIDSFAYKLITEEEWTLVLRMDEETLKKIQQSGETVSFQVVGDAVVYEKEYEVLRKGAESFLIVSMERYGIDYLEDRFLDAVIFLDAEKGLKIPKTSVVEKELYQIPERFVTRGGGLTDSVGVIMEVYDAQSGEVIPRYTEISPLFYENGYYFVSTDVLESERYIHSVGLAGETERAMLYSFLTKMEGVYNMNKGYAIFKRIQRLTDIGDYILVRSGLSGGVSLYDHIVLDVSAVTKDVILIEGE